MSGRTAAGFAIALAVVVGSAPVAAAQDAPDPAEVAAGWLARQLVDGDHMTTEFDGTAYPDHGLTADVVLALDAAGVAQESAAAATAWLAANTTAYLGDGTTSAYAGAHAKLALVAQAQGEDPTDFGGVDLIARLTSLQAESGRFSDKSEYGDYSNGITQSLAVLALTRDGGAPDKAVDYLLSAACPDGGFPLLLEQTTCVSDVDTTGYAVQALVAAGEDATKALDWLEGKQQADGGFGGSDPTPGVNANSTGLAATALTVGDRDPSAAIAYLLKRQVDCGGATATRGAIAYDTAGFDAATAARATTQAIPGLTGVSLADVTNDGAAPTAPTLTCTAPPVTTTTTTTTPVTTTTSAATPVDNSDDLARTGANPAPTTTLGALLVLAGAALVFATRRRPAQ
ncbi:hypothetical protein GCM10023148_53030 [Actinokineospora soli]